MANWEFGIKIAEKYLQRGCCCIFTQEDAERQGLQPFPDKGDLRDGYDGAVKRLHGEEKTSEVGHGLTSGV
jgi:hypothetical protein